MTKDPESLHRVVCLFAALNLAYFGIEFAVAIAIGSVSLFADSIDFLEDAAVNFLIFAALGWSAVRRARVGMALSGILLAPALAMIWTLLQKLSAPVPPAPVPLTLAGTGALAVNLFCAVQLARYRHHSGSLTKAAFLSARNDALANVAIIAAGFATAYSMSIWPDVVVSLGIAIMNADAARDPRALSRRTPHNVPAAVPATQLAMTRDVNGAVCRNVTGVARRKTTRATTRPFAMGPSAAIRPPMTLQGVRAAGRSRTPRPASSPHA